MCKTTHALWTRQEDALVQISYDNLGRDHSRQMTPRKTPPMRWLDNIKTNYDFVGLDSVVEAGWVARDRTVWKLLVARHLSPEPSCNVLGGQL